MSDNPSNEPSGLPPQPTDAAIDAALEEAQQGSTEVDKLLFAVLGDTIRAVFGTAAPIGAWAALRSAGADADGTVGVVTTLGAGVAYGAAQPAWERLVNAFLDQFIGRLDYKHRQGAMSFARRFADAMLNGGLTVGTFIGVMNSFSNAENVDASTVSGILIGFAVFTWVKFFVDVAIFKSKVTARSDALSPVEALRREINGQQLDVKAAQSKFIDHMTKGLGFSTYGATTVIWKIVYTKLFGVGRNTVAFSIFDLFFFFAEFELWAMLLERTVPWVAGQN